MHPELRAVFAFFAHKFPNLEVAIHGSALRDYPAAKDIDVMVLAGEDFVYFVGQLGTRYSGWNVIRAADGTHTPLGRNPAPPGAHIEHLRRTIYPIWLEGVSKPVQLGQSDKCVRFSDHPHALLLDTGVILNAGRYYAKPRR